jgi:hypothetical protein
MSSYISITLIALTACFTYAPSLHADAFQAGVEAYEESQYETAKEQLTQSISEAETAAARHNLALAHFQLGQTAEAVWQIERAQLLEPYNTDYRYKLGALRQQLGLFESKPQWHVITAQALPSNAWILVAMVSFWLLVAACLIPYLNGTRRNISIQSTRVLSASALTLSLAAIWLNHRQLQYGSVITNEPAGLHAAPAAAAPQSATARPGERARIIDQYRDFYQVETESKATGWISKAAFRPFHLN